MNILLFMSDNIWEIKSESIFDGKPETSRQFQYFQQYLMQDGRRSVRRLHEDLEKSNKKSNKMSSKKIPKYETLRNYCHKFNWVDRLKAYDQHQMNLMREKREVQYSKIASNVADFNLKELDSSILFVDYSKTVLHDALELYEAGEISLHEFNKFIMDGIKTYCNCVKFVQSYDPMDDAVFNDSSPSVTFQDLFKKKGAVIDEFLEDEKI